MELFLLAFLSAFGLVVGLGAVFVALYRRHVRQLRRLNRGFDQLAALTLHRGVLGGQPPPRWLAIRSTNTALLRELLRLDPAAVRLWSEALSRFRERSLFLSPPVDGWSLVIGGALPDPAQDVDFCFHFLTRLSREIGEVQLFSADRVLNYHSWIRLRDGLVVRAYAWAGTTEWNEGRVTLDERLLGLRIRSYGEEAVSPAYGEMSPEQTNSERVVPLARRWSVDPIIASELIIQQEHLAGE
ncbi:MAG: hypothetical protein EXS36_00320 [Pedosphaera sp.]|nr:hypothetical protein [Pedosphaera sp.]